MNGAEGWISLLLVLVLVLLLVCFVLLMRVLGSVRHARAVLQNESRLDAGKNEARLQSLQESVQILSRESQESLSRHARMEENMRDISAVMTNAKRRGSWGEYQLESLLRLFAGDFPGVLQMQKTLSNGRIADCAFFIPQSGRVLCIDSKFPMENYLRFLEAEPEEEAAYQKLFEKNVRKHIDDIADRYILPQETAEFAVLFLPSESLYQFVCGECFSLSEYAMRRHVVLAGPTTLAGIVFTLLGTMKDALRSSRMEEVQKELAYFEEDLHKLQDRQKSLSSSLNQATVKNQQLARELQALQNRYDRLMDVDETEMAEAAMPVSPGKEDLIDPSHEGGHCPS